MRPMLPRMLLAGAWICCAATCLAPGARADPVADALTTALRHFAQQDAAAPPRPGGIVFTGSSSIERWNLDASFPGAAALNRGIGGTRMPDIGSHLDELALRYRPRTIVLYAGDNDIAAARSPAEIAADFQSIADRVRATLPDTRLVFIGIKPSLARWTLIAQVRETNALVRRLCDADRNLVYVDIEASMLDDEGRPRAELFDDDGLHLSAAGYRLWARQVAPSLD